MLAFARRLRADHRKGGPPISKPRTQPMLLAALALAVGGSAFAFHCPADMAKIDAALAKSPEPGDAQMSEVRKYRAGGESLHRAGKHQESIDTLAGAMKILDIK